MGDVGGGQPFPHTWRIDANYPALDRDRIEKLSIEFAYRLHLAEREH